MIDIWLRRYVDKDRVEPFLNLYDKRVMNELAAFVGNIDRTSARIFYDCGKGLGKNLFD